MYVSQSKNVSYEATKWALSTTSQDDLSRKEATAQMLHDHPMRFHVGIFEFSEDIVKGITILLLGLAALFLGVRMPLV
jgi:hypothetical protein